MNKYKDRPLREHFESLDDINRFVLQFYRDGAEIYDCLSREPFWINPDDVQ